MACCVAESGFMDPPLPIGMSMVCRSMYMRVYSYTLYYLFYSYQQPHLAFPVSTDAENDQ